MNSTQVFRASTVSKIWVRYVMTTSAVSASRRKMNEPVVNAKIKPLVPRVLVWENMSIKRFAEVTRQPMADVIDAISELKNSNNYFSENDPLKREDIQKIMFSLGVRGFIGAPPIDIQVAEKENELKSKDAVRQPPAPPEKLKPRRPVVTIMGHVDHGKTTLLDTLRKTRVVDQEFGGITQHIGAFSVPVPQCAQGAITFLDTPGHAAFSAMRARGANVTDIVILVVAADDGVMEQTVESIKFANAAEVPMVVAINKMDKADANPDHAKQGLLKYGIQSEVDGGDVQFVEISAKKGTGISELLEAVAIQGELLDLKATDEFLAEGYVIESSSHPHLGKLCTLLVDRGKIRKGSYVVAGTSWGKVRTITDENNKPINTLIPGCAAQITGWKGLPSAGDLVLEVENEKRAKEVAEMRQKLEEAAKLIDESKLLDEKRENHHLQYREKLEEKWQSGIRYKRRRTTDREKEFVEDEHPELCLVIKGDTDGSVEAVMNILERYDQEQQCRLEIITSGVGPVSSNDIEMAEMFNGIIYALHVDVLPEAQKGSGKIPIKKHRVIYHLIDDIKEELSKRLPLADDEEIIGEGIVQQEFLINERRKQIPVAGSKCLSGEFRFSEIFRIVRDEETIFEGKLSSMKHQKNEVKTINTNVECGLRVADVDVRFQTGDLIYCLKKFKVSQKTAWSPKGF